MTRTVSIAVDGPAASGKSTVAEKIASRLNFLYFDTGVMYRAVTLAVLQHQLDPGDENGVAELAQEIVIDVRPPEICDGRQYDVILDGKDVTWKIRSEDVNKLVSLISTYKGVRDAMTSRQRYIGLNHDVVMVGRDIGTVVLPEADLKFYLDASVEERAKRRYLEDQRRGVDVDLQDLVTAMRERDRIDSTRKIAPLKPAEDALIIDTTHKTVEEVVEEILIEVRSSGLERNSIFVNR
jgi:CMP/dCMP kinase